MVMYLLHIVVVQDPIIFLFYCLIYKIEKKNGENSVMEAGRKFTVADVSKIYSVEFLY